MRTKNVRVWLFLYTCLQSISLPAPLHSQAVDRITAAVDTGVRVSLPNSVHREVLAATTSLPVDPLFAMDRMILLLDPSGSQQSALQTLLTQQQNPASPNYHRFLTPAQYGEAFGVSQGDLSKVTAWLTSSGFRIDEIPANHLSIVFSGNAAQVQSAFRTEIRQYIVRGETHYANATAPQIPAALTPVVQGFVKFNDFHSK